MSESQTVAGIITRIEQAIQRVSQAIAPLTPARMTDPRLSDGRSVKDLLAHLTWWDQWLLSTLPADPNTPHPLARPPLWDQIPSSDHWADEMNAKIHAYNQSRELSVIRAEFSVTYDRLLERVSQLSIDDLYNPDGVAAMIGQPVAPLILGIYEHYEEHAHELEQLG